MASHIAVDDDVARVLHESMHLDLSAGESMPSPTRRFTERPSGRLATNPSGPGTSHGMSLQFPDGIERHAEDESSVLRAAEETLYMSAEASRMAKQKPIVGPVPPDRAADIPRTRTQVKERDEKPPVDWRSEPDMNVAEAVTLLRRPVCVPDSADESKRIPFDRADAELDRQGYPTGRSLRGGAVPIEYPFWETTVEDLGRIGGVGLRMYFTIVRGLAVVFAVLALCSIPTLVATGTDVMFDVFDAQIYGCAGEACIETECCSTSGRGAIGLPERPHDVSTECKAAARGTCDGWQAAGNVCSEPSEFVATLTTPFLTRLTLGNICATPNDVQSGSVPALWIIAVVGVITSLALVAIVLRASAHMKDIKQDTDASMVSMSDYTVRLIPTDEHWHEYAKVASGQNDVVKGTRGIQELTHDVEEALERSIPGARVAEIDSKAMIVVAWNEDQNIRLWAEKLVALRRLEEAIAVAFRSFPDSKQRLDRALKELDKINHEENALSRGPNARRWRPVSIFVTFEQDEHREDALKLGRIKIGSQECLVVPADEPETIQWANLQYSKQNRRIRRIKIHTATVVILLIGFALLIFFNDLKESAAASQDPADKGAAQTWATVATFAVVAINQILKRMMIAITPYEKAHTLGEYQGGVAMRVFVCQLLNTAILMLILRSNLPIVRAIPGDHFEHVNAKWYAAIGAPLVGTMFIQYLTPAVAKIITYAVFTLKVRIKSGKAVTQHALNELLAPDEFNIAASFGEVLLATTVSLLFGSGIPILYWVAAAGFTLRFNLDKWAVLRFHRKPPLYGSGLFDAFDETFALLVLGHIAMFVYFLGTAGGTDPTGTIGFSPFRPYCWPMFVAFLLATLVTAGKVATACFLAGPDIEDADDVPTFSYAYQRSLIVNEDDDYVMAELEELQDLQHEMLAAVEDAYENRDQPFASTELCERVFHGIKSSAGISNDHLGGSSAAGSRIDERLGPSSAKSYLASPGRPSPRP